MDHNDEKLRSLMKMGKTDLPFEDFEERVMAQIEQTEKQQMATNYQRNGLLFFIGGIICGIALNYFTSKSLSNTTLLTDSFKNNLQPLSILIYVILIILLSDTVLKLVYLRRKKLR